MLRVGRRACGGLSVAPLDEVAVARGEAFEGVAVGEALLARADDVHHAHLAQLAHDVGAIELVGDELRVWLDAAHEVRRGALQHVDERLERLDKLRGERRVPLAAAAGPSSGATGRGAAGRFLRRVRLGGRLVDGLEERHLTRADELRELARQLVAVLVDEALDEVAHRPRVVLDDEAVALGARQRLELRVAAVLLQQLLQEVGVGRVGHEHLLVDEREHARRLGGHESHHGRVVGEGELGAGERRREKVREGERRRERAREGERG